MAANDTIPAKEATLANLVVDNQTVLHVLTKEYGRVSLALAGKIPSDDDSRRLKNLRNLVKTYETLR